jgi:CCR4-NOT transcription complex subunit 2
LFHSFLSPLSDVPCRLQDIGKPHLILVNTDPIKFKTFIFIYLDYPVPVEYIVNSQIKDKLAPMDLNSYHDDLLFYLFYMNGGDMLQLQVASVLYERDWRYHIEKRIWLTKVQGIDPVQKTQTYEKGVYVVFDVAQWKRIQMEMIVEYSKLAEKSFNYSFQRPM